MKANLFDYILKSCIYCVCFMKDRRVTTGVVKSGVVCRPFPINTMKNIPKSSSQNIRLLNPQFADPMKTPSFVCIMIFKPVWFLFWHLLFERPERSHFAMIAARAKSC